MIGEIRDQETASIAVQASITGHLVVSTMHTNNAVGTLNRMADMGVESYLIADSMVGVIAQRLVRKLCPHCKKSPLPGLRRFAVQPGSGGSEAAHGERRTSLHGRPDGHGCVHCIGKIGRAHV